MREVITYRREVITQCESVMSVRRHCYACSCKCCLFQSVYNDVELFSDCDSHAYVDTRLLQEQLLSIKVMQGPWLRQMLCVGVAAGSL